MEWYQWAAVACGYLCVGVLWATLTAICRKGKETSEAEFVVWAVIWPILAATVVVVFAVSWPFVVASVVKSELVAKK